jgi:hypothetical protein
MKSARRFFWLFNSQGARNIIEQSGKGKVMKSLREFSLPLFVVAMGISIVCALPLSGALSNTNRFTLKMALTNNMAVFNVQGSDTNMVGAIDLFFKTNFTDSPGWTWLMRCPATQTNLVLSNLPPSQGFFMLGSTNNIRPAFDTFSLPREDDDPSTNTPLPFTLNFFGATLSNVWVNNNGNVTFDNWQASYTPDALNHLGIKIIAPYWADVDTRDASSQVVTFGTNNVDGHAAFGVDWVNVGYFSMHTDKQLSCQLVLIDRSDITPGDFDMEFNYDKVQWEWGDANPPNTAPPRAGFSDGNVDYELPGSGVVGSFVDTNPQAGLIYLHSSNSIVPGRYIFPFRNGQPQF